MICVQCNAWWKHKGDPNGRLLAIWPGSQLHGSFVFDNPRWEDYEYEILPTLKGNPLEWLGNGLTKGQIAGENTTYYLDNAYVPVENPLLGAGKSKVVVANGHNGTTNGTAQRSLPGDSIALLLRVEDFGSRLFFCFLQTEIQSSVFISRTQCHDQIIFCSLQLQPDMLKGNLVFVVD